LRDTVMDALLPVWVDHAPDLRALAVAGAPWAVVPYRDPAPGGVNFRGVTIWRDRIFHPWTNEPFSPAAARHRHFDCSHDTSEASFEGTAAAKQASGQEPLWVGASGAA